MGNNASRCKGEVDKPHEKKGKSEMMKASEVVDASMQVTPDNVSIASHDIEDMPLPEQVLQQLSMTTTTAMLQS